MIAAAQSMEHGAKDLRPLGEEGLRQVLATGLAASFGGLVTAESLNANGRTDLLVRDRGGANVFIGECKVWGGAKALIKGLDQLLGYATQADRGLGLIIFVRTKDLSRVLAAAEDALTGHTAVRLVRAEPPSDRLLRLELDHPQDRAVSACVAVLFIPLPNERSEELGGEVQEEGGLAELLDIERGLGQLGGTGLRYQVQVLAPGETPLDPGPDILVREEREHDGGRVVIDAEPTTPEAAARFAVSGAMVPAEDEDGIRAQMLIAEAMKWHVGVEIRGGLDVSFDSFPPALAAGATELEEGKPRIVLEPRADWSWPVLLHVETDRGEAQVELALHQVAAEEGWEQTLRGSFHNLSISMNMGSREGQTQIRWRLHPTDASVADRLAALDFLYASSGEGKLTWTSRSQELPSGEFKLSGEELDDGLLFDRAFFGDLVSLGEWLGRDFALPNRVSQQQILEIASAAALVRAQGGLVRWSGSTWRVPRGEAEIGELAEELEIRLPVDVEIFGEPEALGSGATKVNAVVTTVEPIDEEWIAATLAPRDPDDSIVEITQLQRPSGNEEYER